MLSYKGPISRIEENQHGEFKDRQWTFSRLYLFDPLQPTVAFQADIRLKPGQTVCGFKVGDVVEIPCLGTKTFNSEIKLVGAVVHKAPTGQSGKVA